MRIYTKKGDDGTTGLLFGGRIPKDDVRAAVYGTLDEVVSALGLARAAGVCGRVEEIVVRIQRELFVVGAELATGEQNRSKLEAGISKVTPAMTERAEADIDALIAAHPLPEEFILPGETASSAALDLARSVARRAERQAVTLERAGLMADAEVLRYLNRISDLFFALARYEEAEQGKSPKPSRQRRGKGGTSEAPRRRGSPKET